ncbi:helix-turn-helix domain-containing protein [Prolixibacteraceae bacterium]|nr:helix-turn-helix domain-containing protein [Prolixibacteraceae bacterium]
MTSKKYLQERIRAHPNRRTVEMLLREILSKYDHIIHTMVQIIEIEQKSKSPPSFPSPKEEPPVKWVDAHVVLNLLHISKRTLLDLRLNGEIPYCTFHGVILFKERDIYKFMDDHYGFHIHDIENQNET